jgi:hypothetical protein
MPLTMRPTGLGHGVYKDDIDYSVFQRRVVYRPNIRNPERL